MTLILQSVTDAKAACLCRFLDRLPDLVDIHRQGSVYSVGVIA